MKSPTTLPLLAFRSALEAFSRRTVYGGLGNWQCRELSLEGLCYMLPVHILISGANIGQKQKAQLLSLIALSILELLPLKSKGTCECHCAWSAKRGTDAFSIKVVSLCAV